MPTNGRVSHTCQRDCQSSSVVVRNRSERKHLRVVLGCIPYLVLPLWVSFSRPHTGIDRTDCSKNGGQHLLIELSLFCYLRMRTSHYEARHPEARFSFSNGDGFCFHQEFIPISSSLERHPPSRSNQGECFGTYQ